jgi:hypothetical protein
MRGDAGGDLRGGPRQGCCGRRLRLERARGPEQVVIPHVDADRDADRRGIPSHAIARRREIPPEGGQPFVGQTEPCRVPGVRVPCRELEHPRSLGSDQDRHVPSSRRDEDGVRGLHPAAIEIGSSVADQAQDDRQRFLEPPHLVVGGVAECLVFGVVPATAQPKDQAPIADVIQRGRHLRQQGRVPETRGHHDRAQPDAARRLGDRR